MVFRTALAFIQKTSMDPLLTIGDMEDYKVQNAPLSFRSVEYDTPTHVVMVQASGPGKHAILWFQQGINFWVLNQIMVENSSKLGALTGKEPVPCWWKRGT